MNDLDLSNWRAYDDLITDSLWLLGSRDKSSSHLGDYWGNFVPQIPNQILRRFTKQGDWVVDLFSGMGTTLIECRKLGRHGIGVELNPEVASRSRERIAAAHGRARTIATVLVGDSTSAEVLAAVRSELGCGGRERADCVFLHPPYHDIIRFGDDPRDLSNAPTEEAFLAGFGRAVANAVELLRPEGHLALVIGDAYRRGEWRPLGFECMERCRRAGLALRAINVKDIQGNVRAKGQASNLWRYRALREGFYVFKHEYVMLFRKPGSGR
ncbi:MAG TPA: DNA methyltransferase [Chloroflexota bacterium]|nr:DNA methyltransferase [Chloroflexota bacterium]